jgi:NADH-quinone oxidoreductase subunit G
MFTTKLTNLYVTDVVLTTKTPHWVIEGPRAFDKDSVINKITILKIRDSCNRYRRFYIKGREQDRLKSMPAILRIRKKEDFKHGNI